MVSDPDVLVRYQLAFSLGALAGIQPARSLAALAIRDGADPWSRTAILSSVTGSRAMFSGSSSTTHPFARGCKDERSCRCWLPRPRRTVRRTWTWC